MAKNSTPKKVEEQDPLPRSDDGVQEEPTELTADEIMAAMNANAEAESEGRTEESEDDEKRNTVETAPPSDDHRAALFDKYDRGVAKKGNSDLKSMTDPANEVGDAVMEKTLEENGEGEIKDAAPDEADEPIEAPEVSTPKPGDLSYENNPNMRANPDDANDPLVKTQVYGHVTWVPTSSLVSSHQQKEASKIKVERAKETLAQAGELPTQQPPPTPAQPSPDVEAPAQPQYDEEQLDKAVDSLQYGNAEQAKQALKDLLSAQQVQQAPMPPAPSDVPEVVNTVINARQEREELTSALETFKTEYEDLYNDERLRGITVDNIHLEIAMDFINAGFTPDEVQAAYPDAGQLVEAHAQARHANSPEFAGFRNHNELFKEAGNKTREWRQGIAGGQGYGGRPAPTVRDRQANKEGIKNSQPSDRGTTPPASRARKSSTQQTRKDAITALREGRGQTYG